MRERRWESEPRERPSNADEAADPQAIVDPGPLKPPLADNDPTKTISPSERIGGVVLMAVATVALLVQTVATVSTFVGHGPS